MKRYCVYKGTTAYGGIDAVDHAAALRKARDKTPVNKSLVRVRLAPKGTLLASLASQTIRDNW